MTLEGTNTYLVGSHPAYVIDPGPADRAHLAAVRRAAEQRGGIAGVLLTHSHADHSAGVPVLEAPLLFGAVGAGDETSGQSGVAGAVPTEPVRAGPFEALPTPGHAVDHFCFVLGEVGFCGDLVLGRGSTFVPPGGGSLTAYLDSLELLRAADLRLLCPGHGPYIEDPASKIDEYLAHRLMRERRLIAGLEGGERSRAALLDLAWADVPQAMRSVAAVVMEAHLDKLEAEGRLPQGLVD